VGGWVGGWVALMQSIFCLDLFSFVYKADKRGHANSKIIMLINNCQKSNIFTEQTITMRKTILE